MWFPILHNLDRHHAKFEGPRWLGSASYGPPFFQRVASKGNTCKMIQRPYLGSWATNKKTKVTFFSSTFKVWESKVSLLFLFVAQEPRYWQFLPLTIARTLHQDLQKKKWSYLGSWALNKKTKDTFFSSTFKVGESKLSLDFWFMAQGPRYCHFLPPGVAVFLAATVWHQNDHF